MYDRFRFRPHPPGNFKVGSYWDYAAMVSLMDANAMNQSLDSGDLPTAIRCSCLSRVPADTCDAIRFWVISS